MPSPSIPLGPSLRARRAARVLPVLAALVVCGVTLAAAPARAVETEEDVRKSREHYKRGNDAFLAGNYTEAYREFEAGYALVPRPLFLLNMAHSERKRGEIRKARALYKRYLVVEPESKFRGEVESVIQEIDSAIAADDEAARTNRAGVPAAPGRPVLAPAPAGLNVASGPPAGERPVYKRWWFWAAAGAAVTAVVVTGVLLSRGDSSYEKAGSLGTLGTR